MLKALPQTRPVSAYDPKSGPVNGGDKVPGGWLVGQVPGKVLEFCFPLGLFQLDSLHNEH